MVTLLIEHSYGFFSCCSVRLHQIINYFNKNTKLPENVDSTKQFTWYKPEGVDTDITHEYFDKNIEDNLKINFNSFINYHHSYQFINYKLIDYVNLIPFIKKYFSPSTQILNDIKNIETKYNLLEKYNNICVIFYRGNDKATETTLCSYDDIIYQSKNYLDKNPGTQFLVQSDETEFIERALKEFPNSIVFNDEIRHMPRNPKRTVDWDVKKNIFNFSKYYLAITIIMSKCKYIICGSGNCSIWIMFYRGHANNICQFLNGEWIL